MIKALSFQQSKDAEERDGGSLNDLDVAAPLLVALDNWDMFIRWVFVTKEGRNYESSRMRAIALWKSASRSRGAKGSSYV